MDGSLLIIIGLLFALLLLGSPVIFAIGFAGVAYFFIEPGMLSHESKSPPGVIEAMHNRGLTGRQSALRQVNEVSSPDKITLYGWPER